MFHMDKEMLQRDVVSADAYVSYGPVADAHNATDADYAKHTWLVEVSFTLYNNPSKRWIAVIHEKQYARNVSCELGEDTPMLAAHSVTAKAETPSPAPVPAPALPDNGGGMSDAA